MKMLLTGLIAGMLWALPAHARDMLDEKTHEYTPYGVAIVLIATAQASEMNCNTAGQISLALAKAKRMGIAIDLNDKEDYSAVVFQATQIISAARKEGIASWCKAKASTMDTFLRSK